MWFVLGMIIGSITGYVLRTSDGTGRERDIEGMLPVNRYHSQQKQRNLTELVHLFKQQPEVRNHDVQELLNVSPKTARNYFDTLEQDGIITQHGMSGRDVYYTLNR